MNSQRVFVIGLDGATFDLLDPWIAEGRLPFLQKFLQGSSYGRLESTIPPISPPAWTSFMTGVNPGKHGIYDFMAFKPNSFEKVLVNSTHIRSKRFWDLAGEKGKKSIILNIPLTYPPHRVDGVMISGIPLPPKGQFIYPEEMERELEEKVGIWRVDVEGDRFRNFDEAAFLREIDRGLETRFRVADYFLSTKRWDLFILVIMETDMVQHLLWEERERCLFPLYKKIDDRIGTLLKKLREEDIVVILSDHGFGPVRKTLYLNTWLKKKGFLKSRKEWTHHADGSEPEIYQRKGGPSILRRVRRLLKKPKQIIDWRRTEAYFFDTGQLQGIGINLKGREPEGIVIPEKYEALRQRIIDEMGGLVDEAEGTKVIERVFRREEIYQGPYVKTAPDIVFIPNYEYIMSSRIREGTFKERKDGRGVHRLHGIFMIRGAGIKMGNNLKGIHIMDVAPTILYLLGLPVPTGFDGKVLTEVLLPALQEAHPVRFEEVSLDVESSRFEMAEDEIEEVKKKLMGLGYIE
jgi:predicted AlkP superfamily phosphohydrolase/phosphomutase